jgi:hypothetical protein
MLGKPLSPWLPFGFLSFKVSPPVGPPCYTSTVSDVVAKSSGVGPLGKPWGDWLIWLVGISFMMLGGYITIDRRIDNVERRIDVIEVIFARTSADITEIKNALKTH